VFGYDTTSPDSTVSAAGRLGSIVPELTVAADDSSTWVTGCLISLLAVNQFPKRARRPVGSRNE
jgi:hypothetical protein